MVTQVRTLAGWLRTIPDDFNRLHPVYVHIIRESLPVDRTTALARSFADLQKLVVCSAAGWLRKHPTEKQRLILTLRELFAGYHEYRRKEAERARSRQYSEFT